MVALPFLPQVQPGPGSNRDAMPEARWPTVEQRDVPVYSEWGVADLGRLRERPESDPRSQAT